MSFIDSHNGVQCMMLAAALLVGCHASTGPVEGPAVPGPAAPMRYASATAPR